MRPIASWLFALLLSVALAGPAFAAPTQVPLADILSSLKIQERPSDYVVIVDTSASMTDQGRYDKVKSALASMLAALRPADRVALVTFDSTAVVRFNGAVGNDPTAALAALPAQPTGQNTDIGTGIDAGLKLLEASTAQDNGALALVTDGKVDAPGSPYADPASPAWAALKARADALVGKHDIGAYALGLITTTDAALLHQVFAKAVDIPADQFSARLAALRGELLKFQATEKLRPDLAKGVTASWSGIDWGHLPAAGGDLTGTLTLTSAFAAIPVEVSGLKLTATSAVPLTATLPGAAVTLAPGAKADVPVTVHVPPGSGTSNVTLSASAGSPWGNVLTEDLGLTFEPKVTPARFEAMAVAASSAPAPAPAPAAWPSLEPFALPAAGVLVVAALLALLLARLRGPQLQGSLAIIRDGRPVREFMLEGRRTALGDANTPGLTGRVRGVASKGREAAVQIKAAVDRKAIRLTLRDGETGLAGPYTLTYTARRSRAISMIVAGLGPNAVDGTG